MFLMEQNLLVPDLKAVLDLWFQAGFISGSRFLHQMVIVFYFFVYDFEDVTHDPSEHPPNLCLVSIITNEQY